MKISIIITSFNCEKYISRAIRSCIDQSMDTKDYEIIVVDDGSTDNTKHILSSFGDWIRVIELGKNKGLPYACNVGIEHSLSKFVLRVDADDYIHEDLLRVEYLFLSMNNNIGAVSCDFLLVDDAENIVGRGSGEKEPIACGILFRKDCLVDIGLYDESFKLCEEHDLRARYLKKYSITNIPLPLYRYRMHRSNSTKNAQRMEYYRNKLVKVKGEQNDNSS